MMYEFLCNINTEQQDEKQSIAICLERLK
jgi:hypothetical protein